MFDMLWYVWKKCKSYPLKEMLGEIARKFCEGLWNEKKKTPVVFIDKLLKEFWNNPRINSWGKL